MSETSQASNNKRIAKNTVFLYFRMLFLMAINLYTSRVILRVLGVVDYGIFNVVAGIITMLGVITGPLGGAASRYITVALGKGNFEKLKETFGSTLMAHIIICIILLILAETIGLWFVMNKLNIPQDRYIAALFIYQFSIITAIVSLISVPYNAVIIAHERMDAFAYISIFEVLSKLAVVFLLEWLSYDYLIMYGAFLLIIQVLIRLIYTIYCKKHFKECNHSLCWNFPLLKEIIAYSSWSSLGYLAVVGYTQGLNILLNMFFGPVVNAARGIAVQVQSAILQLCSNFLMAINPQITKSYATNNLAYMHKLIVYASKYSFYIMILVIVPVMINVKYILGLWLGNVPDHTVAFIRLTLLIALLECVKNPVITAIHATGIIKKFQTVEGFFLISIVPIAYWLLWLGVTQPEIVFIVYLVVEFITQIVRLKIVLPRIQMKFKSYIKGVIVPIGLVSLLVVSCFVFFQPCNSFSSLIYKSLMIIGAELVIIMCFGLQQKERMLLMKCIKSIISKNHF